ncbi:MAG: formate dehydrogenase accessory protein FdhE [Desulfohalobiaceae bacterium]
MNQGLESELEAVRSKLQGREDIPEQLVQLVQDIVQLHSHALAENQASLPEKEQIAEPERHLQGVPLFTREQFTYDQNQADLVLEQAIGLLAKDAEHLQSDLERLQEMLSVGQIDKQSIFQAHLENDQDFFLSWAESFPGAPGMLRFLAQTSLYPSLYKIAEHLLQYHEQERSWDFGYCPVCGSLPLICLLQKQGQRYGCCSFCGVRYMLPRLGCVFCGEKEAARQDYFYAEQVPGFKVDVCQTCNNYIKTADFRQMDRHYHPALDDLESLPLDLVAQDKGYTRPTLSAWGF